MSARKLQETSRTIKAKLRLTNSLAQVWERLPLQTIKPRIMVGQIVISLGLVNRPMGAANAYITRANIKIDAKVVKAAGTTTMSAEATITTVKVATDKTSPSIKIGAMAVTEMEGTEVATIEATIIEGTISANKVALMKSLTRNKSTPILTTVYTIRTILASSATA